MDVTTFVRSRLGGGPTKLWHHRLQHLDVRSVYALQTMMRGMTLGKISHSTSTLVCEACTKGKQYATKWGNNVERLATKPLNIIYSSVCGPMKATSVEWRKYLVIFVDDFSRKVQVYMMKFKGE